MAVTQRQIAEHLGISHQAVSFALGRRTGEVSEATRKRVVAAAEKLGYRANTAAQAIATGKFGAVGFMMGTRTTLSSLQGGLLQGIHEVLDGEGIHMTLSMAPVTSLGDPKWVPKFLRHEMVDGLLINYTHSIPSALAKAITRHRVPAIWLNSKRPRNCVYFDDRDAAYRGTKRLISLGHRNVLFSDVSRRMEDSGELHYSHLDREAGYRRAMKQAGLNPRTFFPSGSPGGSAVVGKAIELLRSKRRPTAVLGYGGDGRVWLNAGYACGMEFGRDLSYITFRTEPLAIGPRVGVLLLPEAELGRQAANRLLTRISEGIDQKPVKISIPMEEGDTVGPPAR